VSKGKKMATSLHTIQTDRRLSPADRARGESVGTRAFRRFRRHRLAMVSVGVLLVVVTLFQRYPPDKITLGSVTQPPSAAHWLGTDRLGRDIWSRSIHAGRISLAIGLASALISLTIGTLVGAISGFYLSWVDMTLQRVTDIAMRFPGIVLMLTLSVFVGSGVINTILIISAVGWMGLSRLMRAEFMSARQRAYVESARCVGVSDLRIIFAHILPNAMAPALASAAFAVGTAILTEASLSFLGLGVPLSTPSWGNMMEAARNLEVLRNAPWMWMPPAFLTVLTVLCVNYIGDGLRDVMDPLTLL
jgi:peptide/nickel transport system permease protein